MENEKAGLPLLEKLNGMFAVGTNSDVVTRTLTVCGCRATLFFLDGLVKDDVLERVLRALQQRTLPLPRDAETLLQQTVTFGECAVSDDTATIYRQVSTGCAALVLDCYPASIIIMLRGVPTRSPEEPQNDKVLRGPKIGFTETLVRNTALLRRHVRDTAFLIETVVVGRATKTQVAVCYLRGRAEPKRVARIRTLLEEADTDSVSMGAQSVSEILVRKSWYNPFPKFRYTERPDTAAASVLEGNIILLTDNSPQAIILPVSIFDFMQQAEDFYMPPAVGSYLKVIRFFTFLTGLYLTPLWYLFYRYPQWLPQTLQFIVQTETSAVPVILQFLLIEFAIDGLRLASLNTPDPLANSLSVVGGLILGDIGVEVGWFLPQTLLYAAIVAIANFVQQSYELGYASKFSRIAMLILTALFGIYGFVAANLLMLTAIVTNKTVDGRGRYFYPVVPFNGKALLSLMFRRRKRG